MSESKNKIIIGSEVPLKNLEEAEKMKKENGRINFGGVMFGRIIEEDKNYEEVVEMERKTWKEYLEDCDICTWKWSNLNSLDIVDETNDEYIAKIYLSDILDDPYLEVEEIEETGETMINWGGNDWVVITDYDENHEIFIKIDKTRDPADYCYHSADGNLYVDGYEK